MWDRRSRSSRWSFMSSTAAHSNRVYAIRVWRRAALSRFIHLSFVFLCSAMSTRTRSAPTTEKKILFSLCCDFAMSTISIYQRLDAANSNGDDANAEAESYSKWATKRGDKTGWAAHNSEKGAQNSCLWWALFALHIVMIPLKIWDLIIEPLVPLQQSPDVQKLFQVHLHISPRIVFNSILISRIQTNQLIKKQNLKSD